MPRDDFAVLCIAAAVMVSAQGISVEAGMGLDAGPGPVAGKAIGGIPVFNYDRAYRGATMTASSLGQDEVADPSLHEEDWIVALKPGTSSEQLHDLCAQTARGCSFKVPHHDFPAVGVHGTEDDLAAVLRPVPGVARFIELDATMTLGPMERGEVPRQQAGGDEAPTPNTWGLERIGRYRSATTGRGVHVYVADTGIRHQHVDFAGRASPFIDVTAEITNGTGLCSNAEVPSSCAGDWQGHGTHCAGTVAGSTYGVAPGAQVYAAKVVGPGLGFTASTGGIIRAFGLISTDGQRPAVVSCSFGAELISPIYETTIDSMTNELITVVVSAGNSFYDACLFTPGYIPSSITVGASDKDDSRASFSNWGACVDIYAPGVDIWSADGQAKENDAYVSFPGTSMACPHVAGAAALLLEANSSMSPSDIVETLRENASVNFLTGLSPQDPYNALLYVGSDGPPTEQEEVNTSSFPSDDFFLACRSKGQSGPDAQGVCQCRLRADRNPDNPNATMCYQGDAAQPGCKIPPPVPGGNPFMNEKYNYMWNCPDCVCRAPPEAAAPTPTPAPTPAPASGLLPWVVGFLVVALLVGACAWYGLSSGSEAGAGVELAEEAAA